MPSLHALTATQALAAYRTGELSPVTHLEALIERVESEEGRVNAVMERLYVRARLAAADAERRYAAADGAELPALLGLPILAKEGQNMVGLGATRGSATLAGATADQNHPSIDKLTAAGAVIFGRTTTPEFSCAAFTHTQAWGVTRNPWNPDYTPGGSSGGSAAAVAAGYAPLATASDIGGSTRLPAAFCGLVGFKTPYGRTAGLPPSNMDWYRGDHMLARTVRDAALATNAILGRDKRDHASIGAERPYPLDFDLDLTGVRVAVCHTLGDYLVEPEVRAGTDAAVAALVAAGAEVSEVEIPLTTARIIEVGFAHYGHFFAATIRDFARGDLGRLEPYTRYFVERAGAAAERLPVFDMAVGEAEIQAKIVRVFDDFDVLLTPASAIGALPAGEDFVDGIDLGGRHLEVYMEALMAMPFNIANRCPAVSMPSGVAESTGIPTAVQVVGPPYEEEIALRVSAVLEDRLGFTHDALA